MTALLRLPVAGAALARGLAGQALVNARSATAQLAGQVAERRVLAPVEDAGPGALSRLSRADCEALLRAADVGRLAYVARAGTPDVVPVNYAVRGDELLIRSGPGPKLQAAERRERVAVEVDELDPETRTGWSVVVTGRARRLSPAEASAVTGEQLPTTWAGGPRSGLLAVRMERVDGRRLH